VGLTRLRHVETKLAAGTSGQRQHENRTQKYTSESSFTLHACLLFVTWSGWWIEHFVRNLRHLPHPVPDPQESDEISETEGEK